MERIPLKSEKELFKKRIKEQIKQGTFTAESAKKLEGKEKELFTEAAFEIYSESINTHESLATLEYLLMAAIRILTLKVDRVSLSKEDEAIQRSLNAILARHDITNRNISVDDWAFDYMAYAQHKSLEVLENRKQYKKIQKEDDES